MEKYIKKKKVKRLRFDFRNSTQKTKKETVRLVEIRKLVVTLFPVAVVKQVIEAV